MTPVVAPAFGVETEMHPTDRRRQGNRDLSVADGGGRSTALNFLPSAGFGALEKTFPDRWRAAACWKSLFCAAGGQNRLGKDFSGALASHGAPEKAVPTRWRTPTAQKSLFWHAGGPRRAGKDFFGTLANKSGTEKWPFLVFLRRKPHTGMGFMA